jgi:hypothetical protein
MNADKAYVLIPKRVVHLVAVDPGRGVALLSAFIGGKISYCGRFATDERDSRNRRMPNAIALRQLDSFMNFINVITQSWLGSHFGGYPHTALGVVTKSGLVKPQNSVSGQNKLNTASISAAMNCREQPVEDRQCLFRRACTRHIGRDPHPGFPHQDMADPKRQSSHDFIVPAMMGGGSTPWQSVGFRSASWDIVVVR